MQTSRIALGGLLAVAPWAADGRAATPLPPEAPPTAGAAAAVQSAAQDEPDGKALFLTNCARCHGENGDGQGVTELDRPARSFKDGGFSYGNTVEAIVRTITNGIPGTPMPAFDSSSTEAQRRAMAEYVISLGPPGVVVDPATTELVVHDRPLVVRGLLPPIVDGTEPQPRGLLLGTVDGLTFQYRVDDVRLLGVRAGRFVERRDWTGRGGDALEPLGQVVHLVERGEPRAVFWYTAGDAGAAAGTHEERPFGAILASTWATPAEVGLSYRLRRGGDDVLQIFETVGAVGTSVAAGFRRTFVPAPTRGHEGLAGEALTLVLDSIGPGDELVELETASGSGGAALVVRRSDGTVDTFLVRTTAGPTAEAPPASFDPRGLPGSPTRVDVGWSPTPGTRLEVTTLSGTTHTPDHLSQIRQELGR